MAPLSFSPDASISSHTLSVSSLQPSAMDLQSSSATILAELLKDPIAFIHPSADTQASILSASKAYLDTVAAPVGGFQAQRQQLLRKRKRDSNDINVLHLRKLYLEGFSASQVYGQARKVIDAATEEVELSFPQSDNDGVAFAEGSDTEDKLDGSGNDSSIEEEGADWESAQDDMDGEDLLDDDEEEDEDEDEGEDEELADNDESMLSGDTSEDDEAATEYRPDPNGLNDGFFSIDDFNRQSEFLEQQDFRGEPVASDDEEVDYDIDPFKLGDKPRGEDDDEGDSEEEGPTFDAPDADSEDDDEDGGLDDFGDMTNANQIYYKDFFAPPAVKAGKNKKNAKKRGRPNPHNFPSAEDTNQEDDIEATMSRHARDLFEDDDDAEEEALTEDLDPADPRSRRSTYERRQAKLAEEIRRLEAANVQKRSWQLAGEARAADRPTNALLEEDLEFERAGKPVPVITAEISEDLESLIKRRILAGEFDEVVKRRPDDLATGKVRRGQFQLDDTKSGKGLAALYEEEHLRQTDPNYVDARDEKLKKEHEEISALWKSISGKLDSLSSWHYKPKPAVSNLEIRVDAPAIEMEDARPTAGGEVAGASMLAPQELYKPGDEKNKTEIVTKSGMPIAREEMTREQKLRRRRREKEKIKKANLNAPPSKETGAEKRSKEKKQMVGDLRRGGVQIIGKKGQLTDVEGRQVVEKQRIGAGSFKL